MISSISDGLKSPIHFCTEQALGKCVPLQPNDPSTMGNIARKVYAYVVATFFLACAALSLGLWFTGDMIEWVNVGNKPFEDPTPPFKIETPEFLDPKTDNMGASISTFQYTSDKDFCKESDWGQYCAKTFTGEKAHLGPGQGVDVLTESGRLMLAQAIRDSHGNMIRFNVEWADVLNKDGSFNDIAMQRYVDAAEFFCSNGILPMICLHHFVSPLDEKGNMIFESKESVEKFVTYAKYIYEKMSPHTNQFMTFNEPHVNGVQNYILNDFPAKGIANFWMHEKVTRNMLDAHTRVHEELHKLAKEKNEDVIVGLTHQALRFMPSSRWNYLARIISYIFTYVFHDSFMQWAEKNTKSLDLVGVQYYTTPLLGGFPPDSTCRKGEKMVDAMRFRFHPQGLYPILMEVGERLGKDVELAITEFGTAGPNNIDISDDMDEKRGEYMQQAFAAIKEAQKTLKIATVLFWGLFPNLEWNHGSNNVQNFGMIAREGVKTRWTCGMDVINNVFMNTSTNIMNVDYKKHCGQGSQ